METSNNPNMGGNPTNRPGNCSPFTVEFTTSTGLHKVGEQQYIESTDIKIGRSPECNIRFGDDCKTVSREHASIRCMGGRYVLEHLSASNETYVNGKNVTAQYVLSHRDTIQFSEGGPKILFIAPGAVGSNAPVEESGGSKTERSGSQSNAESTTQRPSAGTSPVRSASPSSSSCLPFTIEFEKKSQLNYAGQRRSISETEVLIGRSENALIRFGNDCNEISTEHAMIRCKGGQWVLEHRSRTNETYLNGRPVTGEAALSHGSIIHLSSLQGQGIRFYMSGSAENTGRVQQGGGTSNISQTSPSARVRDIVSSSNRKIYLLLSILGAVLVFTLSFLGWKFSQTPPPPAPVSVIIPRDTCKELRENFPEKDFEKFIFFAEGQLNIKLKGKIHGPFPFQGTAFLDNKGNLITARHVVELFDFPEDCDMATLKDLIAKIGGTTKLKRIFNSPIAKEIAIEPDFKKADTEPLYPLPNCDSKTCSASEDWAVAKPSSLQSLAKESSIIVDRELSKTIGTSTPLYILGYKDSKGSDPQLKRVTLDIIQTIENDQTQIKFFKCNEPSFGHGDSGAPVFAYNETICKWVVIGIVIKMENYWSNDSKWGIILPINLIPEDLLD